MPIQQKVWKIGAIVGILLAVYLLALSIGQFKSIGYIGSGIQPTNTIAVDGTGDAYAIPDVATFSFTVTETAKTVTAAQTAATTKANAALAAVKAAGVADKDIQTTSYNINPDYQYQNAVCPQSVSSDSSGVSSGSMIAVSPTSIAYCPPGKSVLTGYDVSETVTVKVRNLDNAGSIFASIGSLGVQNVNGLDFSVDNPDAVQAQARATAIADAQTKAKTLASQLGVSLARIVSFSENNNSYPQPIMYAMSASTGAVPKATTPTISTGQEKVTDNVTITYEIE
jgi:hypothetical protein